MITQKALTDIRDSDPERVERAGAALAQLIEDDDVFKLASSVFIWTKQMHLVALTTISRIIEDNVRDHELVFAVMRETHKAFQDNSGFTVLDLESQIDDLVRPFFNAIAARALFQVKIDDDRRRDESTGGDEPARGDGDDNGTAAGGTAAATGGVGDDRSNAAD